MFKSLMKFPRALVAGLCLLAAPAFAQIALYEGPDRTQRLLDGAKREGLLSIYTSMVEKDMTRLVNAFEKKYNIKVKVWRAGTDKVLQRVISEARAGHSDVDFLLSTAPEMEALVREKLLQKVNSPMQKDLIPAALPAHREWTGMRVYVFVQPYNTQKIVQQDLPQTYQDLLNPKWKGKLALESKHEWFHTLVQSMGEEKGLKFFRDVVAVNGMQLRNGSSVVANLVAAGELPLALNIYNHVVLPLKEKGAPIDFISLKPTVASTDGVAILRNAPHPHAATLFYDFVLSEGQKIVADNSISTHKRDEAQLARFQPIVFSDPVKILDSYDKWDKLFDDIASGRSK
jgi:iron(III) transport system substrate-binding protein